MDRYQTMEETDWTPVVRAVMTACGPDCRPVDRTSILLLLIRMRGGLSRREMSSYLDLPYYDYKQLEKGRTGFDTVTLAKVAVGLRIHVRELYSLLPYMT